MTNLIDELQNEHNAILDILSEIKTLGISSARGQEKLAALRDLLIAHIKKEDELYYPALKKAAESNGELKVMMDYFVSDMEVVSRKAMNLFEKYSYGGNEADFAGDFKLLMMTLKDRIQTEESTLFRKFQLLN